VAVAVAHLIILDLAVVHVQVALAAVDGMHRQVLRVLPVKVMPVALGLLPLLTVEEEAVLALLVLQRVLGKAVV
jgi:hypothetical protein